jgi:hypothetical protein
VQTSPDFAGRWVPTFAADGRPGDVIRIPGEPARRLVWRNYPNFWAPNLRLVFPGDVTRTIPRSRLVEIWDADGSVSQRVQDLSARAIR